jgi:predicted nucleic acid-binding protein
VDACSLAGALTRNLLLTLAEAEFFRLRWSDRILNETESAIRDILAKKEITDAESRAKKARASMEEAFEDAMVIDYEQFLSVGADMPDKDDAHVLAAALKTQAAILVTENLKDFPAEILTPLNLEARTADAFIPIRLPSIPDALLRQFVRCARDSKSQRKPRRSYCSIWKLRDFMRQLEFFSLM